MAWRGTKKLYTKNKFTRDISELQEQTLDPCQNDLKTGPKNEMPYCEELIIIELSETNLKILSTVKMYQETEVP